MTVPYRHAKNGTDVRSPSVPVFRGLCSPRVMPDLIRHLRSFERAEEREEPEREEERGRDRRDEIPYRSTTGWPWIGAFQGRLHGDTTGWQYGSTKERDPGSEPGMTTLRVILACS